MKIFSHHWLAIASHGIYNSGCIHLVVRKLKDYHNKTCFSQATLPLAQWFSCPCWQSPPYRSTRGTSPSNPSSALFRTKTDRTRAFLDRKGPKIYNLTGMSERNGSCWPEQGDNALCPQASWPGQDPHRTVSVRTHLKEDSTLCSPGFAGLQVPALYSWLRTLHSVSVARFLQRRIY